MKKIITFLIMITFVMFLVNISYASDSDVIAELSNTVVQLGDTITLSINISEVKDGIAGLQGKIVWDKSQLTYISSQVGNKFSTLNFNDDSKSESLGTFSVYGNEYVTTGETMFTVTFKVDSSLIKEIPVIIDITQIKAEYQNAGTVDIQDKKVKLSIMNETNEDNSNTNSQNTNTNTSTNTNQNTTNGNNISTNIDFKKNTITANKQNTLAPTKLPAAGIKNLIILSIVIIAIATIIFKIKSRKIKY